MGESLFKPRGSATLRRPTDNNQRHGVVVNPPRYAEIGGLSSASKAGKGALGMKVDKPADGRKVI